MRKLRLMTILGTRPEIIRLSEVIKKCDSYFDHTLVHTGQNYDYTLNRIFFEDLNLRQPDHYLEVAKDNLGQTIGAIIEKSYEILKRLQPNALLILGDTNSALSAIPAKRLKIPIFHMEAGNRCFDENLPEEMNRRIVDHIADVNLCYSEHARRFLAREGRPLERTFVTGSPMSEVLAANLGGIQQSNVMERLGLRDQKFILLSAHREENIDIEANFYSLVTAINEMAEVYQLPVIYSMHPRSGKAIRERGVSFHPLVRALEPFGFLDYNRLQTGAYCVVSDSGTLSEESSYLGFSAVSIRTSTERPEAMEKAKFVLGSIHAESLLQAVQVAVEHQKSPSPASPVSDYTDLNVSDKVVSIIQSYTSIIDSVVWRKSI